ncbi:rhodanese homology domain-containing protein [Comamonas antarctica]|uniref:rhodanese homology domain-containing protein n=1 Tax=Comamonas antarctica TaxID=2743470 RepID=UPI0028E1CEA3|nr:rhodanese homology domain-containing protein [Comamonas antarctica]
MSNATPQLTPQDIRQALMAGEEIALLDVREEAPFAQGHPLWAANLPAGRIEIEAWQRLPRRDVRIAVYDNGEGLVEAAVQRLHALGYTQVHVLEGGLAGWQNAGYELFIDVNVPSKSFGEWLEAERHTPSLAAEEVQQLLDANADVVVLDARRFDEYQTMSIPGGVSVPGAELVLRAQALAPDPKTHIVVNCAGRTRSLIGTQSLINAGLPNRVSALRNGTIGWLLAGQQLDHGADRRAPVVDELARSEAAERARAVADRAGVRRATRAQLDQFGEESTRTTYRFDVRSAEEYLAGHLAGFRNYPGGQLVQETDHAAPVRGARIVLVDDDGVRANMSASWLAQMGWEAWVLDGVDAGDWNETGAAATTYPEPAGAVQDITVQTLAGWLDADGSSGRTAVLDFTGSASYVQRHIPSAWFVLRSQLAQALEAIPKAERYVVTCGTSLLARYAAQAVAEATGAPVYALAGGTQAWIAAGLPLEEGETRLASPRIDRYRRPYEGTQAPRSAMQAYLDWEFGLVDQLKADGTHGFNTL